jgi:septum formation protein
MKLILASASPRRAEILRNAGIQFEIRKTDVDESRIVGELPGDYVRRLALAKALSAATEYRDPLDETLILGADTVVVVDADILGKPASQDDARSMLRRLSGRIHEVHTGLALLRKPGADAARGRRDYASAFRAAYRPGNRRLYCYRRTIR